MSRLEKLYKLRRMLDRQIEAEEDYQRAKKVIAKAVRNVDRWSGITSWEQACIVAAAEAFEEPADAITGPGKHHASLRARHVAAWLMRQHGTSLPAIGQALGGRDHTTALNSVRRVDNDPELLRAAQAIREHMRSIGDAA